MPAPQLDLFQRWQPAAFPQTATPATGVSADGMTPPATPTVRPPRGTVAADDVMVEAGTVRVWYVPHDRARRYRLILRADGSARCTIPRRGSLREARRFVEGARSWLGRQSLRRSALPKIDRHWVIGTRVWFRGMPLPLEIVRTPDGRPTRVKLGEVILRIQTPESGAASTSEILSATDLRPAVERALRRQAERELPLHVQSLAACAGISLTRVSVRNQRTRWGSCSRQGVISLNWRLIQTPDLVRDYIILHELAHRRHLNHSAHFWEEVARLCPGWESAEIWIKEHSREIL